MRLPLLALGIHRVILHPEATPHSSSCRYDKFSYDITDALTKGTAGTHELIIGVYDPTEFAHIPLGKQRHNVPSTDIFYSATSGIWQTVWLEPVSISVEYPLNDLGHAPHTRVCSCVIFCLDLRSSSHAC